MFSKISKSAKFSILMGIVCILLLLGGIYLYLHNETQPIKLDVALEVSQKQSTAQPNVLQPSTSGVHGHESGLPSTIKTSPTNELGLLPTETSSQPPNTEVPASENTVSDNANFRATITTQLEALVTEMMEKYPEVAALVNLSPDEINALYPTPEALETLVEQALKLREEFVDSFRALCSELPQEVRENALSIMRETLVENWGAETTDAVMVEVRSDLGL